MISNYYHSVESAIMLGLITEDDRPAYAHARRLYVLGIDPALQGELDSAFLTESSKLYKRSLAYTGHISMSAGRCVVTPSTDIEIEVRIQLETNTTYIFGDRSWLEIVERYHD